jgi:2-polyprenyl-3-methyl-5-hydroxy-6-metoxy-1,4-benzoquinol methylase
MSSHERALKDEANNVTFQRCQYAYEWCIPYITGKKVLDTGCGLGYGASYMAPHTFNITGIDYDKEVIERNKNEYSNVTNLDFIQGAIPPLPFRDSTFDVVTSYQFIEHIHHRKEFIKECLRVLKPGGKVLITTPNNKRSLARNPFHVHEYTFDEMKSEVSLFTKKFELLGLNANDKVRKYYEENGKFVRMILKWDILGLHKILPSKILFAPYNLITSLMRKKLQQQVTQTTDITTADFFLQSDNLDDCWDIYVVAEK